MSGANAPQDDRLVALETGGQHIDPSVVTDVPGPQLGQPAVQIGGEPGPGRTQVCPSSIDFQISVNPTLPSSPKLAIACRYISLPTVMMSEGNTVEYGTCEYGHNCRA